MSREGLRYQMFSRRALMVAGVKGLAVTVLGGRLYYLSIVKGQQFQLRAEQNAINLRLIAPERGQIIDRNGHKLATNRLDYQVYLIPEQAGDLVQTLSLLGRVINLSDAAIERVESRAKRQRKFLPVTVAQDLTFDEFSLVNVNSPDLPGVFPDAGRTRFYPDGSYVAHVVGYVGNPRDEDEISDPLFSIPGFKIGLQGLERSFEKELRGVQGTRRVEVNSVGREIRELTPRQEAVKGEDIQLTIDLTLQKYIQDRLGEASAGVVVMECQTGNVLAMNSNPTYNPNDFNLGFSRANWQALLNDPRKPLLNKCIAGQYPPGSTIKMVIALAALEKGIIDSGTTVTCTGDHALGDNVFHCWNPRGHGRVTLNKAISQSCDVYFYELAEKLDIDIMAEYLREFGFGQIYDFGIGGQKEGIVPDKAWKRRVLNKAWQLGESLNVSIGQGAMTATPMQLAVMTARLATGKSVVPKIVSSVGANKYRESEGFNALTIKPNLLKMVQEGMRSVMVPGGTAYDPNRPKSAVSIAGKTGTAQVTRISMQQREDEVDRNRTLPWAQRDHALFVGYAPVENPKYVVSVLVDHGGGGSSVAAPIGRDVLDKVVALEKEAQQSTDREEAANG